MAFLRASKVKRATKIAVNDVLSDDDDYSDADSDDQLAALRKDDENTYDINQRVMARYGTNVDQKKSLTNYYIKFLGLLVGLIIIPAEIVLRDQIFNSELSAIKSYQIIVDELGQDAENFFTWFCIIFTWLGRYLFVKCAAAFLYLVADPVLGFKSAFTLYIASFLISILKLFYKVPRPYWVDEKVHGKECLMDFSGPSDNEFFMTFFYSYNIIMFLVLYSEKSHKRLAAACLSINAFMVVIAALCLNYLGTGFYLESIIGVVYGILYTALCLTLDTEIHRISEMSAFIIKTSKKYKFYVMFLSMAAFCCVVVYYNSELITWRVPQKWIVNSQDECKFDKNFEVRLGIDDTFKETSAIFGLIGLTFGASHATKSVDNVTWAYTTWWKRGLRGLIGVIIYVGIFIVFDLIPKVDLPTAYFFNRILPHLFATYILYGFVPVLSKYIGLVQNRADLPNIPPPRDDGNDKKDSDEDSLEEEDAEEEKTPGDFTKRDDRKEPLISTIQAQ